MEGIGMEGIGMEGGRNQDKYLSVKNLGIYIAFHLYIYQISIS